MTELFLWFTALAVFIGILAVSRPTARAVPILVLTLAFLYMAISGLLSQPKPLWLETRDLAETEVLWFQLVEGEGIYLVLDGPRLYSMDWNRKRAEELIEAMLRKGEGGKLLLKHLESSLDDSDQMFHAEPQPAPPPKH